MGTGSTVLIEEYTPALRFMAARLHATGVCTVDPARPQAVRASGCFEFVFRSDAARAHAVGTRILHMRAALRCEQLLPYPYTGVAAAAIVHQSARTVVPSGVLGVGVCLPRLRRTECKLHGRLRWQKGCPVLC